MMHLYQGSLEKKRDISRFGFNAGETDLSGIGYHSKNFILQFGRGRQGWGAGSGIELAISNSSPAYDYGLLELNFKNVKGRFFHGFLESDSTVNRYIVGRGIEWSNNNSLLISISEIAIYSGENRPLDIAYLNPVASHLEIELNDRQNYLGTQSGNGVWQLSIDSMLKRGLRFSWNLLIDEYILDSVQKEEGKANGTAWSFRISSSKEVLNFGMMSIYASYVKIGTNTLRHEYGYNNFTHRQKALGREFGNDGHDFNVGIRFYDQRKFIIKTVLSIKKLVLKIY